MSSISNLLHSSKSASFVLVVMFCFTICNQNLVAGASVAFVYPPTPKNNSLVYPPTPKPSSDRFLLAYPPTPVSVGK